MNRKIKIGIFFLLVAASQAIIAFRCADFLGVPFEIDFIAIVFSIILYACVCTSCKIDGRCLFCNTYRAVRFDSRKKIILYEVIKRMALIFLFVVLQNAILAAVQHTAVADSLYFIVFETTVFVLLMLLQFYLEMVFSSDAGYFLTLVLYIALLLAGNMLYEYCDSHQNTLSAILEIENRFNIVNYTSLVRVTYMGCNKWAAMGVLVLMDIAAVCALPLSLKKTDILERK